MITELKQVTTDFNPIRGQFITLEKSFVPVDASETEILSACAETFKEALRAEETPSADLHEAPDWDEIDWDETPEKQDFELALGEDDRSNLNQEGELSGDIGEDGNEKKTVSENHPLSNPLDQSIQAIALPIVASSQSF